MKVIEYVSTLSPVDVRTRWQKSDGWYRVRIETEKGSDLYIALMPASVEKGAMEVYCRFEMPSLVNWSDEKFDRGSGRYNFGLWRCNDVELAIAEFKKHLSAVLN